MAPFQLKKTGPPKLLKKNPVSKSKKPAGTSSAADSEDEQSENAESTIAQSTQNARSSAICVECHKPRVIYSSRKLSQRQEVLLASSLSESDYTCGSYLFPPADEISITNSMSVKTQITCAAPIELAFYAAELGRKDLCALCAAENAHVSQELKKKFKTVLPICDQCLKTGKEPICQRPFGKKTKK